MQSILKLFWNIKSVGGSSFGYNHLMEDTQQSVVFCWISLLFVSEQGFG